MSEPREAKLYEPPVYCAAKRCKKRLTVAAVNGRSRHCSREHAGFRPVVRKGSSLHYEPNDAEPGGVVKELHGEGVAPRIP